MILFTYRGVLSLGVLVVGGGLFGGKGGGSGGGVLLLGWKHLGDGVLLLGVNACVYVYK
jgi:hypothetical protein